VLLWPYGSLGDWRGLEICISFLKEDFLGEIIDEIIDDAREVLLGLPSSETMMFAGRCFSIFFGGDDIRGSEFRGGELRSCGRGGRFSTDTPFALASSCSMTWAYISSKPLSMIL
jgi:hypothetical protein